MKFYEMIYEIYEIYKPQDMKISRGPGSQPESDATTSASGSL